MKDTDVALHLTTRGSFSKMSTKRCEETLQPNWGTSNLSSYFSMKKMTLDFFTFFKIYKKFLSKHFIITDADAPWKLE